MTSTIWQQCLAQLEAERQQQFETYIRPLQANFNAGQLTLKAPNVYVEKHVRQSYLERIAEFLDSVDDIAPVELSVGEFVNVNNDAVEKKEQPTDQREAKPAKKNTQRHSTESHNLNREFTFDTFVEGKSNELARAAATQVADNAGRTYNPCFTVGSGSVRHT